MVEGESQERCGRRIDISGPIVQDCLTGNYSTCQQQYDRESVVRQVLFPRLSCLRMEKLLEFAHILVLRPVWGGALHWSRYGIVGLSVFNWPVRLDHSEFV